MQKQAHIPNWVFYSAKKEAPKTMQELDAQFKANQVRIKEIMKEQDLLIAQMKKTVKN